METGGIGPHYFYFDVLRRFNSEAEACQAFLQEVTGNPDPFAEEKKQFSAECVRLWWEDEVAVALDLPDLGTQRAEWRKRWRKRGAAGLPLMSIEEMLDAFVAAGGDRAILHIERRDDYPVVAGQTRVVGQDELGRWWIGKGDDDRQPGLFLIEYRFSTEGEFCRYFSEDTVGPVFMTPAMTIDQWREQRLVARENYETIRRYRQQAPQTSTS